MLTDSPSRQSSPNEQRLAFLLFGTLAALVVVTVVLVAGSVGGTDQSKASSAAAPKLPPYWTVHSGDSYSHIAAETGLTVDELETFNPYVNPSTLIPGQRLKLRKHVPPPPPKPKGPRFWTVRTGQTLSLVAGRTGRSAVRLQELNPKLKPDSMQPGDRIRLRR